HQAVVGGRLNDAFDLGRKELHLGLRLELGIAVFDRNHGREALAHIVTGDLRILLLQQAVGLGVLIDGPRQGVAKTAQVRAAIGVVHGVGVTEYLIVVAVVVLQHDFHVHLDRFAIRGLFALFAKGNGFGVQHVLVLIELLDEFIDAVLVIKAL